VTIASVRPIDIPATAAVRSPAGGGEFCVCCAWSVAAGLLTIALGELLCKPGSSVVANVGDVEVVANEDVEDVEVVDELGASDVAAALWRSENMIWHRTKFSLNV
jgi:hypothetical protein